MDEEDLYISPHRQKKAQEIYKEVQEMNQPLQVTEAIVGYLQSGEFLFMIVVIAATILGSKALKLFSNKDK